MTSVCDFAARAAVENANFPVFFVKIARKNWFSRSENTKIELSMVDYVWIVAFPVEIGRLDREVLDFLIILLIR